MDDGTKPLSREVLSQAFEVMGRYLSERSILGEIAVYGGSAIMLQFDWRRTTHAVVAVVLHADELGADAPSSARHEVVGDAVGYAALALDLGKDWLNRAVDAFTADAETEAHLIPYGAYPSAGPAGLRVQIARPEYLCAMKLAALKRTGVANKDFDDALRLAIAVGVEDEEGLRELYAGFFPDDTLDPIAEERIPGLAAALKASVP
jgi:hypothetical protein